MPAQLVRGRKSGNDDKSSMPAVARNTAGNACRWLKVRKHRDVTRIDRLKVRLLHGARRRLTQGRAKVKT